MIALAKETKFCKSCLSEKPIDEFRRRSRNGSARLNQCRACHNEAGRRRRAEKRAKREGKTLDQSAAGIKRAEGAKEVAALCGKLYQHFGGLDGFVRELLDHYRQALPGSFQRTRILEMTIRLTKLDSDRRDAEDDARRDKLSMMTDEELKHEKDAAILDLIRTNPEFAVWAAQQIGWTVIPPSDDDAE